MIKVVAHKSEGGSVGSGTHVANDRSPLTSWESDWASNMTQVDRKQRVDRHRIIRAEKLSSFEPIPSQNSFDGYQVRFDAHVWDDQNSFVRTPNRGMFLSLDAE